MAAEGQQGRRARPPVLWQTLSTPEPTFPPRRACRTHASGTHAATILLGRIRPGVHLVRAPSLTTLELLWLGHFVILPE